MSSDRKKIMGCFKELQYVEAKILIGPYKVGQRLCGWNVSLMRRKLQSVRARILTRRAELSKFETVSSIWETCAQFSYIYVLSLSLQYSVLTAYMLFFKCVLHASAKFTKLTSKCAQEMHRVSALMCYFSSYDALNFGS